MTADLVQLAGVWDFATVPPGGCMAETKVDGWRAIWRANSGRKALFTRGGHPIEGVDHILWRLSMIEQVAGRPMIFDGEFQVGGTLAATKQWCERGWKTGGEAGVLHLFDAMPLDDWRRGGSDAPLYQRKQVLADLIAAADAMPEAWDWRPGSHGRDDPHCVQLLSDEWVSDADDALALARRVWVAGGEGLVLKDAESPYQRKRSDAWRKVKHPRYVPGEGVQWPKVA